MYFGAAGISVVLLNRAKTRPSCDRHCTKRRWLPCTANTDPVAEGGGGAPVAALKQGSVDWPTLVNSSLHAWQDIWPDGYARMGFAGSQTPVIALARGAATIEIGATAMVSAAAAMSVFFMTWPYRWVAARLPLPNECRTMWRESQRFPVTRLDFYLSIRDTAPILLRHNASQTADMSYPSTVCIEYPCATTGLHTPGVQEIPELYPP